ncbi:TerD family protein [Streptomyces albidoflavus]|nr:Stress protein [Streptomyces albidoflavus]PKA35490.1 stress response protein TerZ [Streptomyces sp. SM8]SCD34141.1 Stress response protein SCP2 [Streptomyces sp. IgraMP-1]BDH69671.1 stress response protein, TerZ- and CABP1 [Streptomyces sp. PLM4]RZD61620.1 TerD family protein [Streptomyces albidoflavus]
MREMSKGANVALAALSEDTSAVVVGLSWSSPAGEGDADVSVLLLGPDGKVRHDGDFYFYNHPASPDGSVQLLGKTPAGNGSEDRVSLDLGAVPPGVERIVIAASQYGDGRFGDLDELRLTLADRSGEMLLGYAIEGATDERAFLFGELYLREGAWKFRAIGQGYASGLAGLATDFGIDVDDEGEGEEGAAPPEDAQASATAAPGSPEPSDPAPAPAPPVALPAQRPAPEPAAAKPVRRRPRTAKKKVTLPAARQRTLAENDAWRSARLFPAASLKSDRERETRSTSVLLAAMAQVPEFGRRLTAAFGAPAGRMETFTEVTLPHGETPRRPDGIIRVERAGKLWTALVETKTNGNPLRADQVQSYVDIAARRGYEAVITLSNDVALEGRPLVEVKMDRRRKHKVALWHLSWAEVAHQAQLLIRHEGVGNAAHAWLLQELLHYLQHDNSGCQGFQNMGPSWVQVRNGIDAETLCPGDARAVDVIESWERLVRQVCLRIGGELGRKAMPVQRGKRGADPAARRAALADRLCEDGRLTAELRVDGSPGVLALTADLRTGKLRTSVEVPVPEGGYPLSSAKRLLRMLAEAPADLHVETLVEEGNGPRSTLERLRPEPADLLPRNGERIMGFRLSLFKGMGTTRGSAASGFIRSVDEAVDHFHAQVVAHLPVPDSRPARRPVPA